MAERYLPTTVVAYTKTNTSKKVYIKVLNVIPDKFIGKKASKYFDPKCEFLEIGVGKKFIENYKQKYKITKIQTL